MSTGETNALDSLMISQINMTKGRMTENQGYASNKHAKRSGSITVQMRPKTEIDFNPISSVMTTKNAEAQVLTTDYIP